ncbi:MAG: RHS repeat-associated core domain-containing protein, partial [Christensenellales bacterium]
MKLLLCFIDGNGTRVVEYTYDAWGKLISTTG